MKYKASDVQDVHGLFPKTPMQAWVLPNKYEDRPTGRPGGLNLFAHHRHSPSLPTQQARHRSMPHLPPQLKSLVLSPTFTGGRLAKPLQPPRAALLTKLFQDVSSSASKHGLGWGEWLSITTASLFTLDSPGSLQALHRFSAPASLAIEERTARAALTREVGLKCIGFVGIPKVINNLAALRKAVEADPELVAKLPKDPRRHVVVSVYLLQCRPRADTSLQARDKG